jgi:hypothetical protein
MPKSQNSLDPRGHLGAIRPLFFSTVAAATTGALQLIAILIYLGLLPSLLTRREKSGLGGLTAGFILLVRCWKNEGPRRNPLGLDI